VMTLVKRHFVQGILWLIAEEAWVINVKLNFSMTQRSQLMTALMVINVLKTAPVISIRCVDQMEKLMVMNAHLLLLNAKARELYHSRIKDPVCKMAPALTEQASSLLNFFCVACLS